MLQSDVYQPTSFGATNLTIVKFTNHNAAFIHSELHVVCQIIVSYPHICSQLFNHSVTQCGSLFSFLSTYCEIEQNYFTLLKNAGDGGQKQTQKLQLLESTVSELLSELLIPFLLEIFLPFHLTQSSIIFVTGQIQKFIFSVNHQLVVHCSVASMHIWHT